jgi:hypothetical protein
MTIRAVCWLTSFLLALAPVVAARGDEPARKEDKGTFLGVLFGPRTENTTTTRPKPTSPDTTAGSTTPGKSLVQGVIVTHVLPDSPAAKADLRRGDILLRYDRKLIRDGDHLVQLIRDDKPDRKVPLVFQRGTEVKTVEAVLALGPALKLSSERNPTDDNREQSSRGVTVLATPLESGKTKVTIEYYATGKRQTLSCGGTAAELASTVQKLPERERQLVRIALRRLRNLNTLPTRTESAQTPIKR